MKYRVGVSEKVTKDGKDYRVWKVSDKAGFYLADGLEGEDAEAEIDKIIASSSALAVKLEVDAYAVREPENTAAAEETKQNNVTESSDEHHAKSQNENEKLKSNTAEVSGAPQKQANKSVTPKEKLVCLLRKRTSEKIIINKDVFKLGKDAACVDYVVGDNPTISRNHADIIHNKGGYFVKDKGSLNHTFVDGKKLEAEKPVKLESGSLLQLADEVFEFIQE